MFSRALVFSVLLTLLATFDGNPPRAARDSAASLAGAPVEKGLEIPAGTILPAKLDETLKVGAAKPGETLEARIMQEVPLPGEAKIAFRSIITGSVISAESDADGAGVSLTLRFDHLEYSGKTLSITTMLRAMASFASVRQAETPYGGSFHGSPAGWANTVQIGGDIRYGDGGEVKNRAKITVGKGVSGGVLVNVRANPEEGCEGPVGDDRPQALWLFSADACGLYGLKDVSVTRNGQAAPQGDITLHFRKSGSKLRAGTGMLFRVVARP